MPDEGSEFLSTPSGWRATHHNAKAMQKLHISIHALRVEGDKAHKIINDKFVISIHALRVEGDKV